MSHSHNDKHLFGGTYRLAIRLHRNQYDATLKIINPNSNKPFTYADLYKSLCNRIRDNPLQESIITPYFPGIAKKAKEHPDYEFVICRRAKDKSTAQKELERCYGAELQALMRVLFSHEYHEEIATGNVTVAAFFAYIQDALFQDQLEETRKRLLGAIRNHVLPVIGRKKLSNLTFPAQERICKEINARLEEEGRSANTYRLVRTAYAALLQAAISFHVQFRYDPAYIAKEIAFYKQQQDCNRQAYQAKHLDDAQRRHLFNTTLAQNDNDFRLFILLLCYCGLDVYEIPALHYADCLVHLFNGDTFFSLFIDRRMRFAKEKYAVLRAYNDDYPISHLRSLALSQRTAQVLEQRKSYFRALGLSDSEIGALPLSAEKPSKVLNPTDLKQALDDIIQQAGLPSIELPFIDADHTITARTLTTTNTIIRRDAEYLATYICKFPIPMRHAMFGQALTETDEQAYLDLDSIDWLHQQYCFLRRLDAALHGIPAQQQSPVHITMGSSPSAQHYVIHASEDTAITLRSNYAIHLRWRIL